MKKRGKKIMTNKELASYLELIIINSEKCDNVAEIIEMLKRIQEKLK